MRLLILLFASLAAYAQSSGVGQIWTVVSGTLQSAAVANGNGTVLNVQGLASAKLTVNCSSCSGGTLVNFEASQDGTNFTAVFGYLDGTTTAATSTSTSGIAIWSMPIAGHQQIRARISAYSAGTVTVTASAVAVPFTHPSPNNLVQLNGTTIDTNSGNASAGTWRGVIATNQPNLTTALNVDVARINGVTALMGNGVTGTGSQRVTIASDNTAFAVQGAKTNNNAAPGATNLGTIPALANAAVPAWTEGNQVMASVDLSGNMRMINGATAVTTNSLLECNLASAASTNSTNCKASAGNVYGVSFVNTTATMYYLRLYNSSSAPTCSSATGYIKSIPIPASTTGAGIVSMQTPIGVGYATGIGFCFTGGSSSTDNTNAATGVFGTIFYK